MLRWLHAVAPDLTPLTTSHARTHTRARTRTHTHTTRRVAPWSPTVGHKERYVPFSHFQPIIHQHIRRAASALYNLQLVGTTHCRNLLCTIPVGWFYYVEPAVPRQGAVALSPHFEVSCTLVRVVRCTATTLSMRSPTRRRTAVFAIRYGAAARAAHPRQHVKVRFVQRLAPIEPLCGSHDQTYSRCVVIVNHTVLYFNSMFSFCSRTTPYKQQCTLTARATRERLQCDPPYTLNESHRPTALWLDNMYYIWSLYNCCVKACVLSTRRVACGVGHSIITNATRSMAISGNCAHAVESNDMRLEPPPTNNCITRRARSIIVSVWTHSTCMLSRSVTVSSSSPANNTFHTCTMNTAETDQLPADTLL